MKTREEIIANWETEQYTEWLAIDSYDPISSTIHRVFVGTEDDAMKAMRSYYGTPSETAMGSFYRIIHISASDALAFFKDEVDELPSERGEYTITEAAGILGLSRQRVHVLLQNGQLDGHKRGNTWFIYRYSVENRIEQTRKPFERYELDAYLGDFADDFDVDAIIDEATTVDYRTGNRYWRDGIDLAEVCARHDLKA